MQGCTLQHFRKRVQQCILISESAFQCFTDPGLLKAETESMHAMMAQTSPAGGAHRGLGSVLSWWLQHTEQKRNNPMMKAARILPWNTKHNRVHRWQTAYWQYSQLQSTMFSMRTAFPQPPNHQWGTKTRTKL
jgi:hypothetical protein